MSTIYDELSADQAMELSLVARLMYESRENRRMVLSAMNVSDEADLLDNIRTGAIAEHPAYEPIPIREGAEFQIWGVVIYSIHKH